jgi:hypothetical protein
VGDSRFSDNRTSINLKNDAIKIQGSLDFSNLGP